MLGYTGAFGALKVQADARHDRNSVYGDVDTGKLGLAFDIAPGRNPVRAVAGTAFRAPAFNDLFFSGYGVATIGPEHARSVEAGVLWKSDTSSAGATLYRNKVRDLIAFEARPQLLPGRPGITTSAARATSTARPCRARR